jgi:hypothetical protein
MLHIGSPELATIFALLEHLLGPAETKKLRRSASASVLTSMKAVKRFANKV